MAFTDAGRRNAKRDLASAGYKGRASYSMPEGKSVKQNRGAQGAPNQTPAKGLLGRQDPMNAQATPDDSPPTKPFDAGDPDEAV